MKQKTYIITGASSDIGIDFLKVLENENALGNGNAPERNIIALCQYNSHDAELKQLQKQSKNVDIRLFQCDLSSDIAVNSWITEMEQLQVTPSHILHLAACRFEYMRLKQFDWGKTMTGLNIQVNTLAQLLKKYLPIMAKEKYGKIAVMLTAYTFGVPPKFMSDYMITKYALLGLMKGAASEYSGTGITINGLSPNMIETKFLSNIDKRLIEITAKEASMRRNMDVREVVNGLRFLLSDDSNYMTGINLNMSGGDRM